MNRRDFLKIFAAVTAATAVAPVSAITLPDPNKKYWDCLAIVDRMLATKNNGQDPNPLMDELLIYVRANFPVPNVDDKDEISKLSKLFCEFLGPNVITEQQIRSVPPVVCDEMYVIALLRYALMNDVDLNPNKSLEFYWFHETYGPVLCSTEVRRFG